MLRERRGYSDIDIERERLARPQMPTPDTLDIIDTYLADADARGVDALTVRRVVEMTHATDPVATEALRAQLAQCRSDNFKPPLYMVRPIST